MAEKNRADLLVQANEIRVEDQAGQNTAQRVGQMHVDEIDSNLNKQSDAALFGQVESVTAGANVEVNAFDPQNIIISSVSGTSAGVVNRQYLTGDEETTSEGTFYVATVLGKGVVSSVEQTVTVGDDTKDYFTQDFLTPGALADGVIRVGDYGSFFSVMVDSNSGEQRYTAEVYLTDANGAPTNTGVPVGNPVGDLGFRVIAILDSGIVDKVADNETQINLSGKVGEEVTYTTGQRARYHISGEKVGTQGADVILSLYSGSDHNSYIEVPNTVGTDEVVNESTIPGATTTDALEYLLFPRLSTQTGDTIVFTGYNEYNATTPLTTGDITIDPSMAIAGAYASVYFNGASEPSITGATASLVTGTFVANQLNIYHFFWNTDGKYVLNIQTVVSALPQLTTPTIVAAAGDTLIDLTFSNIDANATTNVLERSTDNVNFSVVGGYNGTDLTYQDTSLTNGTEYFYRYKSQAAGYLDSAYATDSATPVAAGFAFNNCLLFDGVDDDVSFTKYGTGSPDTYSVSMWFRSEDITQIQGLISADNTNWYLRINQASNRFIYRSVGVNVFYDFLGMASTTWYHVVLSVSSGSGRMYLNGVESTSGAQAVTVGGAAGDNFGLLGTDFGGNPFDGRIDEVGLWYGYALTPSDVTTLYNSGNGANVSDVSSGNLHFEYHLDESGSATTATDTSGAGNNGTLNNFPTSGMWIDHNAP